MTKKARLRSGLTLGGEQAEADPLHFEAFVTNPLYDVIESKEDPRCFVIGRTGSGKSAALQYLEELHPDRVVRISPEDLSLPYITDLQVIKFLDSLDVKLDLFWIALWKHVLVVEIIRRRYKIDSPEAKQRFLATLKEKLKRDPAKQAALQYLEDFEGRFWVEADERVREITNTFTERIDAEAKGQLGTSVAHLGASGVTSKEASIEAKAELADRFQRVVNATQLARLNKMLAVLDEEILDAAHFTYVVIDDLDLDWVDERISNDLIRCLFRSVLDMQRIDNLKVIVALRTNIFQELDFGRSGGQEEKFRSLVLDMKWTPDSIEDVLDERVRITSARNGLESSSMRELLPHANKVRGNPLLYIFERTLMRPRDAIAFANECLSKAAGKPGINWENIQAAEREYSAKRLLALRDEWKITYPGIDQLFERFRGSAGRIDRADLTRRIDDCAMLMSDPDFIGVRWLTALAEPIWSSGPEPIWAPTYQPVVRLLYRIGLLGFASKASAAPVFFDTNPLYAESPTSIASVEYFFIHRTFHKALEVQTSSD